MQRGGESNGDDGTCATNLRRGRSDGPAARAALHLTSPCVGSRQTDKPRRSAVRVDAPEGGRGEAALC